MTRAATVKNIFQFSSFLLGLKEHVFFFLSFFFILLNFDELPLSVEQQCHLVTPKHVHMRI